MGAGNVKAVFVLWGDLPGTPFRLLTYMALRSKDTDNPPVYYGGREDLAFGLGRTVPPPTDDASRRERDAAFKAVKVAVGVLTRQGAVTLAERARPGHRNAVYALNLDRQGTKSVPLAPANTGGSLGNHRRWHEGRGVVKEGCPHCPSGTEATSDVGDEKRPPVGDEKRPGQGTENVGSGDANRPPQEEKDDSGLKVGVGSQGLRQPSGRAHARESDEQSRERQQSELLGVIDAQAAKRSQDKPERPPAPTCSCGVVLDPDGSCFICRTAS